MCFLRVAGSVNSQHFYYPLPCFDGIRSLYLETFLFLSSTGQQEDCRKVTSINFNLFLKIIWFNFLQYCHFLILCWLNSVLIASQTKRKKKICVNLLVILFNLLYFVWLFVIKYKYLSWSYCREKDFIQTKWHVTYHHYWCERNAEDGAKGIHVAGGKNNDSKNFSFSGHRKLFLFILSPHKHLW